MAYVALYRKWRPQRFSDVVGQIHITRTLKNAIKNDKIVHAYLFSGPRGTGKTSSAKIFAKAVNCPTPIDGEACNNCPSCQQITQGNSMDIIEIDAASNRGIDEIRDLREKVKYAPVENKYKVYIIDEVHMLTTEAFNALLKTLEEPPKHVIFILATTEPHKIPLTVLSRCQKFDFKRIGLKDIIDRLNNIIKLNELHVSEAAVKIIVQKAEGSMRDALSLLDQCLSYSDGEITEEVVAAVLGTVNIEFLKDMAEAMANQSLVTLLHGVEQLINEGKDLRLFLNDLTEYFRNILLVKLSEDHGDKSDLSDFLPDFLRDQSQRFSTKQVFHILQVLSETDSVIKFSSQPSIALEICLIKATGFKSNCEEFTQQISCGKVNKETIDSIEKENTPHKNLEVIKEQWKKVLDIVRKQRPSTYAYLVEGEPTEVTDEKIMLRFKPAFQLHMQNLNQGMHKSLVEKVLLTIYKQKYTVQGYLGTDEEKKNSLVEGARELFGDSVLEIKE